MLYVSPGFEIREVGGNIVYKPQLSSAKSNCSSSRFLPKGYIEHELHLDDKLLEIEAENGGHS